MKVFFIGVGYIICNVLWMIFAYKTFSKNLNLKNIKTYIIILQSIFIILIVSPYLSFMISKGNFHLFTKKIGNFGLGLSLSLTMGALLECFTYLLYFLIKKQKIKGRKEVFLNISFLFLSLLYFIYGSIHVNDTKITSYCSGIGDNEIHMVVISDTHLGSNTNINDTRRMVKNINALNADIVFFVGDIIDNEIDDVRDQEKLIELFCSIKSKEGVYGVLGNHDIEETLFFGTTVKKSMAITSKDLEMIEFIKKCNIKILEDEIIEVKHLEIIGRKDEERSRRLGQNRQSIDELANKTSIYPKIVLDHEPIEMNECKNANISMMICGHTHQGQIFPFSLGKKEKWYNWYGEKYFDQMVTYTTSGYGVWGPKMRIGTSSEIMVIDYKY